MCVGVGLPRSEGLLTLLAGTDRDGPLSPQAALEKEKSPLLHPYQPYVLESFFLPSLTLFTHTELREEFSAGFVSPWSGQQKAGSWADTLQLRGKEEKQSGGEDNTSGTNDSLGKAGQQSSQAFHRIRQKLEY